MGAVRAIFALPTNASLEGCETTETVGFLPSPIPAASDGAPETEMNSKKRLWIKFFSTIEEDLEAMWAAFSQLVR